MISPVSRAETVVSGMRPTGRLHLGNYWGALRNWVDLQSRLRCFFFVADWHMLTTGYDDTSKLQDNVREMVLDWLAAGLDPAKCVIFKQSDVPEHAELALMLSMITPLSILEENPTWKEQLQELSKTKQSKTVDEIIRAEKEREAGTGAKLKLGDPGVALDSKRLRRIEEEHAKALTLRTIGFLGYPVLQAADVMVYKGTKVPVGQDQLPHLELSREIARKFNSLYGETFPEPQPLVTPTPKLPGIDSRKMSKSYGNTLELYETRESLAGKVKNMYTDPKKLRKDTPGNPDPGPENPPGCVVYALHKLYTPGWEKIGSECRAGRLGCMDDKRHLTEILEKPYSEFRARREKYKPADVEKILNEGADKAREVARATMQDVRRAMRLRS